MLSKAVTAANRALGAVNLHVERVRPSSWDQDFTRWLATAKNRGCDPNDIGDVEWGSDLLDRGLREHYLPHVNPDAVIVELGPGSGRLTRHLVGRCKHLIVADRSKVVCDWINDYLSGKGSYEVHRIDGAAISAVPDATIDGVFAHGVFEHLDLDETYWFLRDFFRVLKPGAVASFNYDTVLAEESIALLQEHGSPTERCLFRLHHPDEIRRLAAVTGFSAIEIDVTGERIDFATLIR